MFDEQTLGELVSRCGFVDVQIVNYAIRNLRCTARRR
jgi:hypothetical protein